MPVFETSRDESPLVQMYLLGDNVRKRIFCKIKEYGSTKQHQRKDIQDSKDLARNTVGKHKNE